MEKFKGDENKPPDDHIQPTYEVHTAKFVTGKLIEQSEIRVIGEGLDCVYNYYQLSSSRWLATFLAHFSNLLQLVNLLSTATSNKCQKLFNIKLYHFLT